jgi:hypothetical protein
MIGDKREESDIAPTGHTGKSPMQIFLYVAGPTPTSLDAIANLNRICRNHRAIPYVQRA